MPADVALCSMATAHSASDARIFALSVQAFEPARHLYLGADASGAAAVRSAWTLPEAQLHVVAQSWTRCCEGLVLGCTDSEISKEYF